MLRRNRSKEMFEESKKFLAGGVGSQARVEIGPYPAFMERGKGSKIYDVDGNEYIDYALAFGPLILGHGHPRVINAVKKQLDKGTMFGTPHELEIKLSKELTKIIPCAELVRFSNSGSEAIQAVLRLARAYTHKNKIVKFEGQYHGWLDNVYVSCHPPLEKLGKESSPNKVLGSLGQTKSILDDLIILPWNNLELLEKTIKEYKHEIAAVITEPLMCNFGVIPPKRNFLKGLRKITKENRILLIFDEIITGFRLALGGAQEYYGVIPDLAVYAKGLGNGFPISCFGGRRQIMNLIAQEKVVHAGTYNTNPLVMAAAYATISELEENREEIYGRIFRLGKSLIKGIEVIMDKLHIDGLIQGPGPVFHLFFTKRKRITDLRTSWDRDFDMYMKFRKALLQRGIFSLQMGLWFVSASHTMEDIDSTLEIIEEVLREMKVGRTVGRKQHLPSW